MSATRVGETLAIAVRELRQQLRGHVFWVVFAISAAMIAGALTIDALRVGVEADAFRDGGAAVARLHLVWTLFYLFTAAALVAEAALRDAATGFEPLVRATAFPERAYRLGRFLGGFAAVALCFLSVPLTLAAAKLLGVPGFGPVAPADFAHALFVLALPNLLLACALFHALAGVTRSMLGCLVGAVALLTLYGLRAVGDSPALLEPFGFVAQAQGPGALLANRLLWLAVSAALLLSGERAWARRPAGVKAAGIEAPPPAATLSAGRGRARWPSLAILAVRTRHEARQVLLTPAFAALLLLGMANALAQLWGPAAAGEADAALLARLAGSFQLAPVVIAIVFAGELVWREREVGIAPLIGATPARGSLLFLAKLAAMALVMLALALATGLVAGLLEWRAGGRPDWTLMLAGYALPKALDWTLFAVLALFVQLLSPAKLAGWGFITLYLIALLGLTQAGLTGPAWRFGGYPGAPVPPALSGIAGAEAWRLGWTAAAAALALLGCALAERRSS